MILTVRCLVLLIFYFCGSSIGSAQENTFMSNGELRKYEGAYEYTANQSLVLAVSPKDTTLYAIIDESRYPLKPRQKDVFVNSSGQEVVFIRDDNESVIGYKVIDQFGNRVFKRNSTDPGIPSAAWYAKDKHANLVYRKPADLQDGLQTGVLNGTGLDSASLAKLVRDIAEERLPAIHSVLIARNGKLVFEEYFYEYDVYKPHQLRSATKSFVSALIGIAIDQGLIKSVKEKVLSFFPEYKPAHPSPDKSNITIEDLLNNESGLACNDHDSGSPGNESKMYPTGDWVKFILDLPMAGKPGDTASYCSGNVMVLCRLIEKVSGKSLFQFAKTYLFDPIQANGYKWNFKTDSTHMNSFGQLYLKPRDMLKFGMLYLNKGKWINRKVLADSWVTATLKPHTRIGDTPYGLLWWHPWLMVKGTRQDAIVARGNGGQRIYLRPDLDMVVVITAGSYNTQSSADEIIAHYILPALIN